ncbi:MAG: hypothetical protein ACF8NJ_04260, partial [Phycisphaerales bacterium JB038]
MGDYLYFTSDRPGGEGGFDIYRARLLEGGYRDLRNLGNTVNTAANELDPTLDMGGFALHFSSDRSLAAAEEGPDYNLFRTTSREVFLEHESYRASIDWGAVAPYLLWALLASLLLLLLLLLRQLTRSKRFQTLGLLARCLLVSVAAHIIMMILLGFWSVGSSFSHWLRDGGGIQVAIVSPSVGQDIAAQVRGGLSQVLITPTAEALQQQQLPPTESPAPLQPEITEVRQARLDVEMLSRAEPAASDAEMPQHEAELPEIDAPPSPLHTAVTLPEALAPEATAETQLPNERPGRPARDPQRVTSGLEVPNIEMAAVPASVRRSTAEDAGGSLAQMQAPADVTPRELDPPSFAASIPQLPDTLNIEGQLALMPDAPAKPLREVGPSVRAVSPPVDRLTTEPAEPTTMKAVPANTASRTSEIAQVDAASVADLRPAAVDAPARAIESGASALTPLPQIAASPQLRIDCLPEQDHTSPDEQESHITATAAPLTRSTLAHLPESTTAPSPSPAAASQLPAVTDSQDRLLNAKAVDAPALLLSTPEPTSSQAVAPQPPGPLALRLPEVAERDHHLEEAKNAEGRRATPPATGLRRRADLPPATTAVEGSVRFPTASPNLPIPEQPLELSTVHAARRIDPTAAPINAASDQSLLIWPLELVRSGLPQDTGESAETEERKPRATPQAMASAPQSAATEAPPWSDVGSAHVDLHDSLPKTPAEPGGAQPLARTTTRLPDHQPQEPPTDADPRALLLEAPPALSLSLRLPTQVEPPARRVGVVRGVVTDASTHLPLVGATVRLDLAETAPLIAVTDEAGRYELSVPDIPDFVAISASCEDYDPASANVPAAELKRRAVERDFALARSRQDVIVIEDDPEVHHLGDNAFSGRINSRFQKQSEGRRYESTFPVTAAQLGSQGGEAVIRLLARGTERNNLIRINGHTLNTPLIGSPRDGRFGVFQAAFPTSWLHEGSNTLVIQSAWANSAHSDLDDFEIGRAS